MKPSYPHPPLLHGVLTMIGSIFAWGIVALAIWGLLQSFPS
jgi:hypothetical protein